MGSFFKSNSMPHFTELILGPITSLELVTLQAFYIPVGSSPRSTQGTGLSPVIKEKVNTKSVTREIHSHSMCLAMAKNDMLKEQSAKEYKRRPLLPNLLTKKRPNVHPKTWVSPRTIVA